MRLRSRPTDTRNVHNTAFLSVVPRFHSAVENKRPFIIQAFARDKTQAENGKKTHFSHFF